VTLDTRVEPLSSAATAAIRSDGYWEDPRQQTDALGSQADLDRNALPEATDSQGPQPFGLLAAADPAVAIDGSNSNPSQRTLGRTPDGKQIQVDPLHTGGEATIARERTIAQAGFGQTYVSSDQLVFTTTGTGNDQVRVSQRSDGTVEVSVNGETYDVDMAQRQELTLRVGAGDDLVEVAPNVRVNIVVDGGSGDDSITTGAGNDRIDGGAGNDTISSGDGRDDVFGNTGNDTVDAGAGDDVVHGGDGNDTITAGTGTNFIEGGAGDDVIVASQGQNMVSAGTGNDRVTSGGDNSVYLGSGTDSVEGATTRDRIHAEGIDAVRFAANQRDTGQVVVNVAIDASLGRRDVTVEGSPSFRQRVEAEIEFLRSSPAGQQMLAEFDEAAALGNTVTIRELANEQNGYAQTLGRGNAEITGGRAGTGSDVIISYNPSFHMDAFPAPQVVLYHEMSHAYNGVTGTFQPGTYQGTGPDSGNVRNAERQAVGLESSAPAFDFDGDPSTPPTTHNPIALTENGIRRELGLPDRPNYTL
jgi:Ca2+-binding RTX toxin-like protein